MASTKEKIRDRRLQRMRLGQNVASEVKLPSDEEIKLSIVPLNEAEYEQCLEIISSMEASDNMAGFALRDRRQAQEILVRAIREPDDLTTRVYNDVNEMMEDFDVSDIDHLFDEYNEMTAQANPRADAISDEEIETLKKVLSEADWNEFSGRSWYALKRFLGLTPQLLLRGNSPGSTSTQS